MIVALMAGIAIMVIASAAAAQKWSDVIRRDNEAEMMFRAQDLVRALKRYQLAQGKLPVELKEMMEQGPQGQYFLRKLWKDPLIKGGKWQLVYLNPAGGIFDPSAPETPGTGDPAQLAAQASLLNPSEAQGPFGGPKGGDKGGDVTGESLGLPIAGVKTRCKDKPFRIYKEQDEYRDWVFSIFDFQPQAGTPNPGNLNPGNPNPGIQPTPTPPPSGDEGGGK
jgi:type II secretory pathway pseudopilin PulG